MNRFSAFSSSELLTLMAGINVAIGNGDATQMEAGEPDILRVFKEEIAQEFFGRPQPLLKIEMEEKT